MIKTKIHSVVHVAYWLLYAVLLLLLTFAHSTYCCNVHIMQINMHTVYYKGEGTVCWVLCMCQHQCTLHHWHSTSPFPHSHTKHLSICCHNTTCWSLKGTFSQGHFDMESLTSTLLGLLPASPLPLLSQSTFPLWCLAGHHLPIPQGELDPSLTHYLT